MNSYKIDFESMDWEYPVTGVKQKVTIDGDKKIRLLRFEDNFVEEDWCLKGHDGYVLDGEMKVIFDGATVSYKKGDGLSIDAGEDHRHKAMIAKGSFVELILFEEIEK